MKIISDPVFGERAYEVRKADMPGYITVQVGMVAFDIDEKQARMLFADLRDALFGYDGLPY